MLTVFVLGGILLIIIFIFERTVSNEKDGRLKKIDGKQCNTIKIRISKMDEIEIHCNDCQSVATRTKKGDPLKSFWKTILTVNKFYFFFFMFDQITTCFHEFFNDLKKKNLCLFLRSFQMAFSAK